MRNADVADVAAGSCRGDRLLHRLRRADALEYRVGTDALGELLDALHSFFSPFGNDFRGAEFAGEFLPRLRAGSSR